MMLNKLQMQFITIVYHVTNGGKNTEKKKSHSTHCKIIHKQFYKLNDIFLSTQTIKKLSMQWHLSKL